MSFLMSGGCSSWSDVTVEVVELAGDLLETLQPGLERRQELLGERPLRIPVRPFGDQGAETAPSAVAAARSSPSARYSRLRS